MTPAPADASTAPVLHWFRRDLRLDDHPGLRAALATGRPVACLFVLDPELITGVERAAVRVGFLLDGLRDLDGRLRARGGGLALRLGAPDVELPRLVGELGAVEVHACADPEPFALDRDARVAAALEALGVPLRLHHDQTVVPHERLSRDDGTPFRTFSSYARAVGRLIDAEPVVPVTVDLDGRLRPPEAPAEVPDAGRFGLTGPRSDLPAGETAALERLRWWRDGGGLERYARHRDDIVDLDATSRLSRYLKLGMLSPRRAAQVAERATRRKFRSELLWRDWFKYVLHHHPDLAERPVDRRFETLETPGGDDHFEAWARGETGFGLVDAGIRQMNETGFMPNRLRMVTASFMVKHLHLDWRRGERLFRDRLVDGDLSSNAGGWQWVAGTGLDAAPFFRVFNPELQERRHDPTGAYVRRWAPDRPAPIVDLAAERAVALELYRRAGEARLVGDR
jgi:deoxyribodipyrimidine photo-lyase